MNKEEIIDKWIYNTPLMPLRECVSNAMDEYASQDKWISVEDRLPDIDITDKWNNDNGISEDVYTYSEFGRREGRYYHISKTWTVTGVSSSKGIQVTHWQPLPPAPIKTKTP